MKQVVRCSAHCGKIIGLYKSYKVFVRDNIKNPLTGEMKKIEYEGRVCANCARDAGYKIKGKKKK